MQEHSAQISARPALKPPIPAECRDSGLEERIEKIVDDLTNASLGFDAGWHLSGVFDSVRRMQNAFIGRGQRDQLLKAISRAKIEAVEEVPRYARARLRAGLEALRALTLNWAAEPLSRDPADICDWQAIARICQNEMHNVSLKSEIETRRQRSSRRRDAWAA